MSTFLLIIFSCMSFCLIAVTSVRGAIVKVKDLIAPPPYIEHYSFGMRPQLADVLWIRSIQDMDYCEEKLAQNLCQGNGWLSKMLLAVVGLDPNYRMVYRAGGLALTVLVSDYEGASKIFDLGVKQYPDDWKLLYAAAYHALYEEKDNKKAARLYMQSGQHGAPEWVFALANRLYMKAGVEGMKEEILHVMETIVQDEDMKKRLRQRILTTAEDGVPSSHD